MSKEQVRHFIEDVEYNLQEEFLIWKEAGGLDITLKSVNVRYQVTHELSTKMEDEDFLNSFEWYVNYYFDGEIFTVTSKSKLISNSIAQLGCLSGNDISGKIAKKIRDRLG